MQLRGGEAVYLLACFGTTTLESMDLVSLHVFVDLGWQRVQNSICLRNVSLKRLW